MDEQLIFPLELSSVTEKKPSTRCTIKAAPTAVFEREPAKQEARSLQLVGGGSAKIIREWTSPSEHRFVEAEMPDGERIIAVDPKSMFPWLYDKEGNHIKDRESHTRKQFIYLIRQGKTDFYKIGLSMDVKQRLKIFNMGSGIRMSLVCLWQVESPTKTEKRIHKQFKEYNKHGEWFVLNEKELDSLCTYMKSIKASLVKP